MIAGNLPVVPTRAALSVSNRPAAASTLPRGGEQQRFFSKTRPAVAPPSFDRQVSQMRQSMQRNGAGTSPSFSSGPSQTSSAARPSPGFRTPAGNIPSGAQQAERGASSSNERTGRPAASDGSGWRRFSDSNTAQRDGRMNRPSGASPGASSVARPGNSAGPAASTTDGGWRHFTPQSGGNVQGSPDRTNNGGGMGGRGSDYPSRYEMSRPQMESVGGRGISQDSPRGYSRPPLEMRQPIVTPRASEVREARRENRLLHEARVEAAVAAGTGADQGAPAAATAEVRTVGRAGTKALVHPGLLKNDHENGSGILTGCRCFFVLRSRDGSSRSPENRALDFPSPSLGHHGYGARGILARNVGDTETPHRSCRIGRARLDGVGRAPSS